MRSSHCLRRAEIITSSRKVCCISTEGGTTIRGADVKERAANGRRTAETVSQIACYTVRAIEKQLLANPLYQND